MICEDKCYSHLTHAEAHYGAAEMLFFKMWLFAMYLISEAQPIITKSSVSPIFKTHFSNQTDKQNATKFIKIIVCTTICLTVTVCSQHQQILSSFLTRVDNEVNISIFCIFLKEENNKLYFRLSSLCLILLFITQDFKIISIRNPCFRYELPPKTEGAESWISVATALHISQICGCKIYLHFYSRSQALILQNDSPVE